MPTLESAATYRLAALIAVEREAATEYLYASVRVRGLIATPGVDYRDASAAENDAMRAMVSAQMATGEALSSSSVVRDGVPA